MVQKIKSLGEGNTFIITTFVILSVIWGSSFILIKKGLIAFDAGQVGSLRMIAAFIVLLPLSLKYIKTVTKEEWKWLLLVGTFSNFLPALLFAKAELGLDSGVTGVLNSMTPMFTFIIGVMFFGVNSKTAQFFGLIIGLTGSIWLSMVGSEGGLGTINFYAIYVIVATLFYGWMTNVIKIHLSHMRPVLITGYATMAIMPFALGYLFSTDFFSVMSTHRHAWASLGYIFLLGSIGTAAALALFNKLIQITTAIIASSITYTIPIVAVLWGIVDGEIFYPLHLVGMLLIIVGVYIVNRFK